MRTCPTCGREWPDQANFCPMDGTVMHADKAPPPASRAPVPRSAAPRAVAARPSGEATRIVQEATLRAAKAPAEKDPAPVAKAPAPVAKAPAPAAKAPAPAAKAPAPAAKAAAILPAPDEMPTVAAMPAVDLPIVDHSATTTEVGDAEEAAGDTGRHFSETAWFMAAVDIESMEVDEDVDVSAMEERYLREGRNPTMVRQKFSLTIGDASDEVKSAIDEVREATRPKKKKGK